jgi:enoyl-CoA hydratase
MQNIIVSHQNNVGIITINRPEKLNALNHQTIQELGAAIQAMGADTNVKGVIITGAGEKAFVAGADITELAACTNDAAAAQQLAQQGQNLVFDAIEKLPKPVIAAVNGFALGGGCELAMACHLRIAAANAKFGQPEVNLGIIPGYGGTQRLVQLVGKGKAIELLTTADLIDAHEAHRLGLANHIVPQEELMAKCFEILEKITTKSSTAVAQVLNCVNAFFD